MNLALPTLSLPDVAKTLKQNLKSGLRMQPSPELKVIWQMSRKMKAAVPDWLFKIRKLYPE